MFYDFKNNRIDAKEYEREKMNIRKIDINEKPPLELLLVADPSEKMVEDYLGRGECYVAEIDKQIIGVYILLPTRQKTYPFLC